MDSILCPQIININRFGLTLIHENDEFFVSFEECAENFANENSLKTSKCVATRDITNLTFCFYSQPKIKVVFKRNFFKDIFFGKSAIKQFRNLQETICKYGYTSYDLS